MGNQIVMDNLWTITGGGSVDRTEWLPACATQRTARELWELKGKSWLARGWSVDAITTASRGGLGIAKDLVKRPGLEVDLGAYATQEYEGSSRAAWIWSPVWA